ncbi:rhodanese-like domain-containing protein [Desulfogranum mediterraneum]|uniref:rhodanese-like domain-containing protein n=1 Tax=Desulfogranum mediterraneum TaxID=160661 RepID=UPI00041C637E|nr:rhodanese-like domain-containing protein [Desulfogranum mediterraneum]
MKSLDDLYHSCTLDYFESGAYRITLEDFLALKKEDKVMMLDLRSKEEAELVGLSFAHNIPIAELPERLAELPRDKTIATFCASSIRAVMAFVYLRAAGFEDVKILPDKLQDLTTNFMPPFAAKHYETLK